MATYSTASATTNTSTGPAALEDALRAGLELESLHGSGMQASTVEPLSQMENIRMRVQHLPSLGRLQRKFNNQPATTTPAQLWKMAGQQRSQIQVHGRM